MAARIGSLFVSLVADMSQFRTDMSAAGRVTAETSRRMGQSVGNTERSVQRLQRTMHRGFDARGIMAASRGFETVNSRLGLLRGTVLAATSAFAGLGAAMTTNYVSRLADEYTNLQNQMRVVTKDSVDLAAQTEAVTAAANRSRSALSATAVLYSRLRKAAPAENPEKILRYTETISKALQLGGATAQEASSAAIQFSQAIASNRLGGEELRAILETPLGLELAKGLGVTLGKFREMGHAGELTANVVLGALSKIGAKIDEQFAGSVATIDQSLNVFQNNLTKYIGEADKAYGVTKGLGEGIVALGNNLNSIMPALAVTAGLLGSLALGRLTQSAAVGVAAPFRQAAADRREALAAARAQAAAANAARTEGYARTHAAAGALRGDQRGAADRASVRAYNNDLKAMQKLDAQRIALLDKQRAAMVRLGSVQQQVTPAAVRAAGNLAQAETRVNNAMAAQRDLRRTLGQQNNRLTGLLGRQAQLGVRSPLTRDVSKQITQTQREIAATQRQALAAQARVTTESAKLEQARAAAHQKASAQVIAALQAEQAVKQQLAANDAARAAQQAALRRAGVGVQASGGLANLQRLQAERAALGGLNQAARESAAGLARASAAARGLNVALAGLRAVGGSLMAFLGGPWGVALAGVIGSVIYFGAKSREASERLENLTEEMRQLGIISDKTAGHVDEVAKSLDEMTSDERRKKLKEINQAISDMRKQSWTNYFGGAVATLGDVEERLRRILNPSSYYASTVVDPAQREAAKRLTEVIRLAEEGEISAERILDVLEDIGNSDPGGAFDDMLDVARQTLPVMEGLRSYAEDMAASLGMSVDAFKQMQAVRTFRSADAASVANLREAETATQSFISERTRKLSLTDRERALEEATTEIVEGIKEAGGFISRAKARSEAESELAFNEIKEAAGKGILDLIAHAEGTANRRGYNETLDYGRWTGGDQNLVGMTLNEILALQKQMLANPENRALYGNGKGSSALGRYQIVSITLKDLMRELGLTGNEYFDPAMQDRLAQQLVRRGNLKGTWEGLKNVPDARINTALNTTQTGGMPAVDESVTDREERLAKAAKEAIEKSIERKKAYDDFRETMRLSNEELAMETFLLGESEAVKERERFIREQIAHLKSNDLPVTREALELIQREAEARFQIVTASEAQKEALKALEEQQKLTIEQMDAIRGDARDVLGGFLRDLQQGKSASEALAGALDKVAQKLLDIGTNRIIDSLFGAQGTQPGGFLGGLFGGEGAGKGGLLGGMIIPGILHGGGVVGTDGLNSGRRVSAGSFVGAPFLHGGLTSREFATVLEKGEHVLTARQTAATAGTIEGLSRAAANSNQRQAVDVRISVDDDGKLRAFVDGRAAEIASAHVAKGSAETYRAVENSLGKMMRNGRTRTRPGF